MAALGASGRVAEAPPRVIGKYAIFGEIASGGMATVHFARLFSAGGFSRTLAVKRLHPQFATDPEFAAMFLDEARIAARIRHPNVVPVIDVVSEQDELLLVMDYVAGESLGRLLGAARVERRAVPPAILAGVLRDALLGLHAAHVAIGEDGAPLGIIHRDVSPQNIVVGEDGIARLVDFGVAKAAGRIQTTREGQIKGKPRFMPPEQLRGDELDRRVDVYAAGVVLWEGLTGRRLFDADNDHALMRQIHGDPIDAPTRIVAGLPRAIDAVVMRALDRDRERRFASAAEMATALEAAIQPASSLTVAAWLAAEAGPALAKRAARVKAIEAVDDPTKGAAPSIPPASGFAEPDATTVIASARPQPNRSTSSEAPRSKRLYRGAIGVAVVLALGGAAVAIGRSQVPSGSAPSVIPVAAPPAQVARAPSPSSPPASTDAPVAASASASAAASPAASASPSVAVPAPSTAARVAAVKHQPAKDCWVSFRDAEGNIQWKQQRCR